jgi:hypothetical protein
MGKVRSDSLLKNLPEDRQEQIMEWCNTPSERDGEGKTIPDTGGLGLARAQLAADGVKVSLRALSDFFSWWQLKRTLELADLDAQEAADWWRTFKPGDEETARKFGEFMFLQKAVRTQDAEVFTAATMARDMRVGMEGKARLEAEKLALKERQLAQKDEQLRLQREKFEIETCEKILAAVKDAKIKALAESDLPNAAKIAALRQTYFADVDAMQQSGKVVLPE